MGRLQEERTVKRVLTPEWMDQLPTTDPRQVRSRQDLFRLNRINRSAEIMARLLRETSGSAPPQVLTDLGTGDGLVCLDVARRLSSVWPNVTVQLLDQQPMVHGDTLNEFARLGWHTRIIRADLLAHHDWAQGEGRQVFMANLVLHHFPADWLRAMFQTLATHATAFTAIEPRRGWRQLLLSRCCLWLFRCGEVARHDGPASVRASFRGRELSALWPAQEGWQLSERDVGLFSHVFAAQRLPA